MLMVVDFKTFHKPAEQMRHTNAFNFSSKQSDRVPLTSVAEHIFRIEVNDDVWFAAV